MSIYKTIAILNFKKAYTMVLVYSIVCSTNIINNLVHSSGKLITWPWSLTFTKKN